MRSPGRFIDLLPGCGISGIGLCQCVADCLFDRFQTDDYPLRATINGESNFIFIKSLFRFPDEGPPPYKASLGYNDSLCANSS